MDTYMSVLLVMCPWRSHQHTASRCRSMQADVHAYVLVYTDVSVSIHGRYPLHKRSMMSNISGDIRIRLTWEDFRDL